MNSLTPHLQGIFFWGIFGCLAIMFASRKKFFQLHVPSRAHCAPSFFLVLIAFSIYFGINFLFYLLLSTSPVFHELSPVFLLSWLNFLISLCVFVGLLLLLKAIPGATLVEILGAPKKEDFRIAFIAWIAAFPLVLLAAQCLEVILNFLFHVSELPEQRAIAFLKATFDRPIPFTLAIISIVILAPLVEELLFRGFLQKGLRRYLSYSWSIFLSSASFSAFHFTVDQGVANVPILGSLFILGLFLGFVYERQQSLLASISLHAIFNSISILNLYLVGVELFS